MPIPAAVIPIITSAIGAIAPKFDTYAEIMKYVTPGNPAASKLWDYLTTNDFNKAMPPVNSNHEMSVTDKTLIFN